jgi:N-hydroxyarylamine O-acetyltransferase
MHIENYLTRIHAQETRSDPPTLDLLARLQQQHLLNVPFENLSFLGNEPFAVTRERLYHKIVVNRRGGFCYELNGAFAVVLEELGYRVHRIQAQVSQGSSGEFGPPFDHLALLVTVEDVPHMFDV